LLAQSHVQLFPDGLPHAVLLELAENIVDRRARRKFVARQVAPRAARAKQIEDCVHRRPHIGLAWPPARQGFWDQWFQLRPFRIRQIARIAILVTPIDRSLLFRPHRESPHQLQMMP
jgi:hypothetical protein